MSTANIYFDINHPIAKITSILTNESYFSNDCIEINIEALPDVWMLTGENSIGVDSVRAIGSKIATPPHSLAYKYIICKDCHLLTEAAQNALLKHLEQNYRYIQWLFFTESKYEYRLLKTLKSRFILHYDACVDDIDQDDVNRYISCIKANQFDFSVLDLDCLMMAFYKLYEVETKQQKKSIWLKRIDRVIKLKLFQQNHLKWSNTTTYAMIMSI